MARIGPGYDWGERSERWAGVISQVVDVGRVRAHYLQTDAAGAARDTPPHLLVHPLAAGSWSWMDVIRPLATNGEVIAPDLPGAGRTRPIDARAGRAEHGARFLGDLCRALDLDQVVLHGHSMGALVSALFAARHPERVARLVLTSPALPGHPDPPHFAWAWRLALGLAPRLARIPMRAGLRWKAAQWRRWRDDPTDPRLAEAMARMGTDASRISPALLSLIDEEIERYRVPWRIDGALQAAVSTLAAMTVDERTVRADLERIAAPTLVVWGDRDRLIPRRVVDGLMEVHPAWTSAPCTASVICSRWRRRRCTSSSLQTGWAAGTNAPWAGLRHRTTRWTPDACQGPRNRSVSSPIPPASPASRLLRLDGCAPLGVEQTAPTKCY